MCIFLSALLAPPRRCFYALRVAPFPTARHCETEDALYNASLRALMRRAHSVHEIRVYLERRAADEKFVPRVLARLREQGYLDDARFALDYARNHAQARRQGRFRIARELRARGVADRHAEAAIRAVFADTNETELIRKRLDKALARGPGLLDQRRKASIYRSLLRAGFSADAIRAELKARAVESSDSRDAEQG